MRNGNNSITLLQRIDGEVRVALEKNHSAFDTEDIKCIYVGDGEFQFSLLGRARQRFRYGAIYVAYVRISFIRTPSSWRRGKYASNSGKTTSPAHSPRRLATSLRDCCWSDPAVGVACLAKHQVLVHNGGRVTDQLSCQNHAMRVESGKLQIVPADTKSLFDLLKEKVMIFVAEIAPRLPAPGTPG